MDSWLISFDKRKPDSTVSERYQLMEINRAVDCLLRGESISAPVYDPVSRRRLEGVYHPSIQITAGILLIEGVVALSDKKLLAKADLKIFVELPDCIRIKRLLDFYSRIKKIPRTEYKPIIAGREKEETIFVKNTAQYADILFSWQNISKQ